MGRSGLYPPPSQSPSYSKQGLGFLARQLWAPFFPFFPFSCNTLISASNCVPRTCSKIPVSDLPWGGNGDRVRLVNSAGVSRGWEGTLGTEVQRSRTRRGHGKGPTLWLPPQLPCHLWVPLWAFASSFLLSSPEPHGGPSPTLTVERAAIYCGLTMCQQLCLHLTFDLPKQL